MLDIYFMGTYFEFVCPSSAIQPSNGPSFDHSAKLLYTKSKIPQFPLPYKKSYSVQSASLDVALFDKIPPCFEIIKITVCPSNIIC